MMAYLGRRAASGNTRLKGAFVSLLKPCPCILSHRRSLLGGSQALPSEGSLGEAQASLEYRSLRPVFRVTFGGYLGGAARRDCLADDFAAYRKLEIPKIVEMGQKVSKSERTRELTENKDRSEGIKSCGFFGQ